YMQTPYGVFGLQPKGIEGFDDPCERIEDMADFYLKAIVRFQPRGPYFLAGYSLGGLVALEMARTLAARGQTVALLAMIDTYPDINFLAPRQRFGLSLQRTKQRLLNFIRPQGTRIRLGGLASQDEISTFAPAFQRVREAAFRALRRYEPRSYAGEVRFIRATEVTQFPANPKAVWSRLVSEIQIDTVPGDHLGMLTNEYETLASVLNAYLESITSDLNPAKNNDDWCRCACPNFARGGRRGLFCQSWPLRNPHRLCSRPCTSNALRSGIVRGRCHRRC